MFTRLVRFHLEPGQGSSVRSLADGIIPAIRAQRGCRSVWLILDDETGDYGLVIRWETKEDANAAAAIIGPQLMPAIAKIAAAPAVLQLFEEYEPGG